MFWLSLVLVCVLFISSIYFTSTLEKSSQELIIIIDKMEKQINVENWKGTKQELDTLQEEWKELSGPWKIFIEHEELDKIQITMEKMNEYIKVQNQDLTRAEMATLKFLVRHIYTKDKINLGNVF